MPINPNDPRVKRTRQLMLHSFRELLEERKNFYSISVQDIAARATVNRNTFYAHFENKLVFLECWMRDKFQRKLIENLPGCSISNMSSLRTLILSVFDFLDRTRQYMKAEEDRQFEPLFEAAMHKELYQLLIEWLSMDSKREVPREIVEATSLVVSWGIFGSALQWSRNPESRAMEEMVQDVLVVVAASLSPVLN